jgi:lipopolysaccharide/colanic/teichoic acid biosynthesis glycosyltransferase
MLVVAIAISCSSPGAPMLRQRRAGRGGREFGMWKFRTMVTGAERLRPLLIGESRDSDWLDLERDPRITRLGSLLRRTSLDELPQLINVLRGEMSLIGPRPERPEFVALFSDAVNGYGDRHRIKSGITGWAQVHGLRGQTALADRIELDNHYIDNWSAAMDLKILALTVMAFVSNGWDV